VSRPTHLTAETNTFHSQGSSALAYEFGAEPETELIRPQLNLVPPSLEGAVRLAHETGLEDEAQARFAHWRGSLAVAATTRIQEVAVAPPKTDLLEQIQKAREGDEQAARSVRLNVSKATSEGFFKKNHITKPVEMQRGADGQLIQFGQSLESVHGNAILMRPNRHQSLKDITEAEALNGQRIQLAAESGVLKDYYYVVFSVVPNGVPEAQLDHRGDGYFLEDLTLVPQATTETNGSVTTESAFMAGVESNGTESFEERQKKRFDFAALAKLYQRFNKEAPSTAAGLIQEGLFIHKSLMPNGVLDPMRWFDEAADEVLGRNIERKAEDYIKRREESRREEDSVAEVENKVFNDLLNADLETPMEAAKLMWKLVKDHGLKEAVTNEYIDPIVFGRRAAVELAHARVLTAGGYTLQAEMHLRLAEQVAVIAGCGGGAGSGSGREGQERGFNEQMTEAELAETYGTDRFGAMAFYCPKGHLNVRKERDKLIPKCQHQGCKAAVACD